MVSRAATLQGYFSKSEIYEPVLGPTALMKASSNYSKNSTGDSTAEEPSGFLKFSAVIGHSKNQNNTNSGYSDEHYSKNQEEGKLGIYKIRSEFQKIKFRFCDHYRIIYVKIFIHNILAVVFSTIAVEL